MVNRRRMNQRGGVESEGATFMSSRFFEATAPSSNAETVTSGNGSFPPMNEHNLITGIPLKAAPGSTALMGGRRRRNMRGGEGEGKNAIVAEIAEALKNLSMEDLTEIKGAIMTSNVSTANAAAKAANELSTNVNATMPNTQASTDVAALAEAASNAAVKANNAATVPEAMAAATEAANLAANAATTVANAVNNTAVTNAANAAVAAVANGKLEEVPENVAAANAALPASNSLTGGKRRRNNKKSSKKN